MIQFVRAYPISGSVPNNPQISVRCLYALTFVQNTAAIAYSVYYLLSLLSLCCYRYVTKLLSLCAENRNLGMLYRL